MAPPPIDFISAVLPGAPNRSRDPGERVGLPHCGDVGIDSHEQEVGCSLGAGGGTIPFVSEVV